MSLLARFGAIEKSVGTGIGTLITAPLILRCWPLGILHIFTRNFRSEIVIPQAGSYHAHREHYQDSNHFSQREVATYVLFVKCL